MQDSEFLVELRLLENAIDFILKGIDELFIDSNELRDYVDPTDVSNRSYKYGILHLYSGFILLLKEALRRHVPELMFKGTIKEVKLKIEKGQIPNTVDLDEALERLAIGPRCVFSESDIEIIRRMQKTRNAVEHFELAANPFELWSNVSGFLGVIDRFMVTWLGITLETSTSETNLLRKIHSIEEVWKRIAEEQRNKWRDEMFIKLDTFKKDRDAILASLDTEYFDSKGAIDIFIECPECGKCSLIIYGEYSGICSNGECEEFFLLGTCWRCGGDTPDFGWQEGVLCDYCQEEFKYQASKED